MSKRTNKFQLLLSDAELQAVEDYRFANRIENRNEAIRRLVEIGLEAGSMPNARLEALRNERDATMHPPHTTLQEQEPFFRR